MNWKPLLFRLPFRFGVVHIGVAKFQAIQPEGHPFKLPPHPDFDQLPVDSFGKGKGTEAIILTSHPIQKPLKRISMVHGMLCYVPETYRRYCVSLSGSFQEYLEKFPAKKRYTVQSKVRKLMKDGGEFQVYRSAEELLRFYPLAREVSRKTWHEALLKGGLAATPEFQEILRARGDQDTARGFLLFKNGSPIAFIYSSVDDGVPILDRLGYDPEFRNASPGTVLQYLALEALFEEQKFSMFDFEEGESQYKQTFATDSLECADIYLFAPTLRAKTLVRAHFILNVFVRAVLKVSERAGVKARLKRLLKTRVAK